MSLRRRRRAAHALSRPVLRHGARLSFSSAHRDNPPMQNNDWVYILANRHRGGMYVGVTSDLARRVVEHREGTGSKHVADFAKNRLVYAERHEEIEQAIAREKLVKMWKRDWKFELIEADIPEWGDLFDAWFGQGWAQS